MRDFWNVATAILLVTLSLCMAAQPALVSASIDDEKSIAELFETYSKDSVVQIISERRNGKITIQKYKTFVESYGKPNLSYITPRSVIHDLKILNISIIDLTKALDEQQKQQEKAEEESSRESPAISSGNEPAPLSVQLNRKINATRDEYNKATSHSERRRLKEELSLLQNAYRRARKNEESRLRVYVPEEKKNTNYNYNNSACESARSQLQEIIDPVFRHQVFFCNDRQYRKENPKTCDGYRYVQQYDLKKYKEEVVRRRERVSKSCGS